jgi:hypothetical protein
MGYVLLGRNIILLDTVDQNLKKKGRQKIIIVIYIYIYLKKKLLKVFFLI